MKPGPLRSRIDGLHQAGSLKLLFPRTDDGLQAVLVNTAGGITGGDRFTVSATARSGTDLTLTTQAAERGYRAQPGSTGCLTTDLRIEDGARLNWLPQETILFRGCALTRRLNVDLADSARLTLVEPLVFGRSAMAETLDDGQFRDRVALHRGGRLLYLDQMRLTGDIAAHLARPTTGAGAGALATVLHVGPDAAALLPTLRDGLPDSAGASLIGDDLLVMRLLAPDSFELRRTLLPILARLTGADLPRPWMI
ncbi:MAG: urease accessory protein UreD [Marinibacterium sp.]|nr:urease accessory protein UreD [Marinibacterium sp.]